MTAAPTEEGPTSAKVLALNPDTDDANSISSQDEDVQAKCSRRAIVNLQRLIDNVTEEIRHEKEQEEGVDDKEGGGGGQKSEDVVASKETEKDEVEDAEKAREEEEEGEGDGGKEKEAEGMEVDEEEQEEEQEVEAAVEDESGVTEEQGAEKEETQDGEEEWTGGQDKMDSVEDNEESVVEEEEEEEGEEKEDSSVTDAETCAPPKLHKELAFLNQDMPVLETAPDIVGNNSVACEDSANGTGEGMNGGHQQGEGEREVTHEGADEEEMYGEAPSLVIDEQVSSRTSSKLDEEDDNGLPLHLRVLSEQLSQELEENRKKQTVGPAPGSSVRSPSPAETPQERVPTPLASEIVSAPPAEHEQEEEEEEELPLPPPPPLSNVVIPETPFSHTASNVGIPETAFSHTPSNVGIPETAFSHTPSNAGIPETAFSHPSNLALSQDALNNMLPIKVSQIKQEVVDPMDSDMDMVPEDHHMMSRLINDSHRAPPPVVPVTAASTALSTASLPGLSICHDFDVILEIPPHYL